MCLILWVWHPEPEATIANGDDSFIFLSEPSFILDLIGTGHISFLHCFYTFVYSNDPIFTHVPAYMQLGLRILYYGGLRAVLYFSNRDD